MYLVTGAAGQLGRAVINNLLTTHKVPAAKIIAATRDPGKLADLKSKGIEARAADFNDEAGLVKAFTGAKRLLVISTDSFEPGVRQIQHGNAVRAAEKAGVEHVLYTSMPKPDTSAVLFAPDHLNTEKALAASGLKGWTVLRHNWYAENLFYSLPHALKTGTQYSASAQGKTPYIARADLARADAAALASDKGGKNIYTLTGAKEYTVDEIAALVSKVTGKALNVVHVPVDGLVQGMVGAGMPEGMAKLFASFDENVAKGGLSGVTGDYKALTGEEPASFESWLAKNAPAFVEKALAA
jgi:NAD(P)H dehydrogenase (quinone)